MSPAAPCSFLLSSIPHYPFSPQPPPVPLCSHLLLNDMLYTCIISILPSSPSFPFPLSRICGRPGLTSCPHTSVPPTPPRPSQAPRWCQSNPPHSLLCPADCLAFESLATACDCKHQSLIDRALYYSHLFITFSRNRPLRMWRG